MVVVPLDPQETNDLTLGEWDLLVGAPRVLFEDPDHPLRGRLHQAGTATDSLDPGEPGEDDAVVVAPDSPLIERLADAGAQVTSSSAEVPDTLSAVRSAYVLRRAQASLGALVAVMARLRGKDGCPWDAQQTHESLQQHLLEEAHEVLETIDRGMLGPELQDELGDLMLQVLFHSELAAEDERFDIAGVADGIVSKLVRRHPHVFADTVVSDASEVVSNWEKIKRQERSGDTDSVNDPFSGIPSGLPALVVASKTLKKAQGLDYSVDGSTALAQAHAALDNQDFGAALLWIVAAARNRHVDAEGALRRAIGDLRRSLSPGA
jgi:XTP/dITP diphosphohydrolase